MAENLSSAVEIYSCCLESLFITCTTEDCYCSVLWTDWVKWMHTNFHGTANWLMMWL